MPGTAGTHGHEQANTPFACIHMIHMKRARPGTKQKHVLHIWRLDCGCCPEQPPVVPIRTKFDTLTHTHTWQGWIQIALGFVPVTSSCKGTLLGRQPQSTRLYAGSVSQLLCWIVFIPVLQYLGSAASILASLLLADLQ